MIKSTRVVTCSNGHRRRFYIVKCEGCGQLFECRHDCLKRKGRDLCPSCTHRKRPFESLYNSLYNDWRGTGVDLTYEEFLQFTAISRCHYCGSDIPWEPFGTVRGAYRNRAYHLDRKDHTLPYSVSNCVVCCTTCNRMRSNKFSYQEFVLVGRVLARIYYKRHLNNQ